MSAIVFVGFAALTARTIAAGIGTDKTMGAKVRFGTETQVVIPDTLGSRRGANLFHSFEEFNIFKDQTVTFTQTQSGTISHVFARVTGILMGDGNVMRTASQLDGTLESAIPGASLFFFNPAGVMFGKSAQVSVKGSFTVSTADQIAFSDRAVFSAIVPGTADSLTSAGIASFGFTGESRGPIKMAGTQLKFTGSERGFAAIAGGGIGLDRDGDDIQKPSITTKGGSITLVAVDSRANVTLDGNVTQTGPRWSKGAGISLTEATIESVGGVSGGSVYISAPKMNLFQGRILSKTAAGQDGLPVGLRINGKLLLDKGSRIKTETFGPERAGDVNCVAGSVQLKERSEILSATAFAGNAGNVKIRSGRIVVNDGSIISSSSAGRGRGGNVSVRSDSLQLTSGGSISANVGGAGQGGNVAVTARDIRIRDGARIQASVEPVTKTGPKERGNAGNVTVSASNIELDGVNNEDGTGIFANNDAPSRTVVGGNISVRADHLSIRDGALITTRLTGPGRAGNIAVKAADLSIARLGSDSFTGIAADAGANSAGQAGNVRVDAGRLFIADGGQISSNAAANGIGGIVSVKAGELTILGGLLKTFIGTESGTEPDIFALGIGGNVFVDAGKLSLRLGGQISATTFCSGPAGDVRVRAGNVFIDQGNSTDATGIFSESESDIQNGASGSVWLDADKLMVVNGGRVSALTLGPGAGGDVNVMAREALFSREGSLDQTGLLAESLSPTIGGKGGSVRAKLGELTLIGATISATTLGSGAGGSVFVDTGSLTLDKFSTIEAASEGAGAAGSVSVTSLSAINVRGGSTISATTAGSGDGGDISVKAGNVTMDGTASIAAAANGTGSAGSVSVTSDSRIDLRSGSSITVKSAISDAGSIRLIAPDYITLQNSTILAEAGLNGGDVFIDPQFVILDHSNISANAILGAGGNITLIADTFLSSESGVTASSEASVQGTIDIQSPDAQLANALTALPGGLLGIEIRLIDRCRMRLSAELSSFLLIGRGGLPPAPDDLR